MKAANMSRTAMLHNVTPALACLVALEFEFHLLFPICENTSYDAQTI